MLQQSNLMIIASKTTSRLQASQWFWPFLVAALPGIAVTGFSWNDYKGSACGAILFGLWTLMLLAMLLTMILGAAFRRPQAQPNRFRIGSRFVVCSSVAWLLVFLVWRNDGMIRLRFWLARAALESAALNQSSVSSPVLHGRQQIGGLDVVAFIRDKYGVWIRTFQHPDGAWGFFKSVDGSPPVIDEPGEQIRATSLGKDWYYYRVHWD